MRVGRRREGMEREGGGSERRVVDGREGEGG